MAVKAIARELSIDPKTVRKVLRAKPRPPRVSGPSVLDVYVPLIRKLVLVDRLSSVRVLEELRAVGYRGGYTILKELVRGIRPKALKQPHLRFETEPGTQGQVDLSPYTVMLSDVPTAVVCFSLILGFSRWHYIRFVFHADVYAVCNGHVLAFEEAGGVPHEILYDRMKQVVLESHKEGVVLHPLFERLAQHYGFRVVPLAPGYKEGKGKVENPFGYVEGNFLAGRTFRDLEDLNLQGAEWLARTRQRVHRTTQEQPIARLAEERPKLLPLPITRFEAGVIVTRVVGDDFCVAWETNRYSVMPHLSGHTLKVRVLEGRLDVLASGSDDVIATHAIRATTCKRYVAPEHEAAFRATSTSRHVLGEQFRRLGPSAERFAEGLREARGGAAGYHMGQILKLAERVGVPRVIEALRHAARYGAFDHGAVARIVGAKSSAPRLPRTAAVPGALTHLEQYLKGAGTHQRPLDGYQKLADAKPHTPPKPSDETDNGK